MFVVCVIVTAVLAFLVLGMGMAILNGVPQMNQLLTHVGAKGIGRYLGIAQVAGAVGLVVGLFVAPIGIAAATCLVLYFLGAMIAHVRVGDPFSQVLNPMVPMILSAVALALRVTTA